MDECEPLVPGKPYLYGLCAGGEAGVDRAMDILKEELERAMGLLG